MKQTFNILVYENYTSRLESILNRFRISLNDWCRSKAFDFNGERVVNYTIVSTVDTYNNILIVLN